MDSDAESGRKSLIVYLSVHFIHEFILNYAGVSVSSSFFKKIASLTNFLNSLGKEKKIKRGIDSASSVFQPFPLIYKASCV